MACFADEAIWLIFNVPLYYTNI